MISIKTIRRCQKNIIYVAQRKALLRESKLKEEFWIYITYKHIIMHLVSMQQQLYYELLIQDQLNILLTMKFL